MEQYDTSNLSSGPMDEDDMFLEQVIDGDHELLYLHHFLSDSLRESNN